MTKKQTAQSSTPTASPSPSPITLKWAAFFDQDLWAVIYQKLLKASIKDITTLLWLQKLWTTISAISTDLAKKRDEIATECGLAEYMVTPPDATTMQSPEYQASSQKFWEKIQADIFNNDYSLSPLAPLAPSKETLAAFDLNAEELSMLVANGIFTIDHLSQ